MSAPHSKHTSTLLTDGTVLITGSQDYDINFTASYSNVAELYFWEAE